MPLLLSVILIISSILRGGMLTHSPPELFGDEIDVGYQAYSLLKTGKDFYGQPLPVYIHSLAEWRAPLLIYATVPSILIFGNTEWGVRLPEVVFGSLTPVLLFGLVYLVSRSKSLALYSAAFIAFMPWHIHYSRAAFEVVILAYLTLAAVVMFIRRKFLLSTVLFALTFYTYSTATVFTPLLILGLHLYKKVRPQFVSIALLLILTAPFLTSIVFGKATERFQTLSILQSRELTDTVLSLRNGDNSLLERLFHNKVETISLRFLTNYLRSFSTEFLFVRGDPTVRHNMQYFGELLPLTSPLLLLGLIYLFKKREFMWIFWLLLAPIPAALTIDGSWHATRSFLMTIPLAVILGSGLLYLKKTKLLFLSTLVLLSINFLSGAHYYLVHYPQTSWRWWHVGFKQAMIDIAKLSPDYSRVIINNSYEPSLIRFLFYTRYSPLRFQAIFKKDQPENEILPGYNGFSLDGKYFFGNFSDDSKNVQFGSRLFPNAVYLISQRDDVAGDWDWRTSPPAGVKVLSTSTNPYNQPIFYLVTKSQ